MLFLTLAATSHTIIDPRSIRPVNHLDAWSSGVVVCFGLIGFAILISLALIFWLRYRWRAGRARDGYRADAPLLPGEAVVHGTVEWIPGKSTAVRVEVTQDGTESESSGIWSHRWSERHRRAVVHPFYLRQKSGQRIRIEPPHQVNLVDDMDGCIRVNLTKRVRVAELIPGEQVFAHGILAQEADPEAAGHGYRSAEMGWKLVPLAGNKMLLSSKPLDEPYRLRGRRHFGFLLFYLSLVLGGQLMIASYYLSLFKGVVKKAEITDKRHIIEKTDDEQNHYYQLSLRPLDAPPAPFSDHVSPSLFGKLIRGQRVPIRYVPGYPSQVQIGPSATLNLGYLIFLVIALLGPGLLYAWLANRPIGWYEGPLEESGSGRLQNSMKPSEKNDEDPAAARDNSQS